MSVTYVSRVRIERQRGPDRLVWLPATDEQVRFGVHGAVAEHYGVSPDVADPRATTVERTHRIHAGHCPVARSIEAAIAVETEYELIEEES